jgi:Sec-independent protein translocase protein TatA
MEILGVGGAEFIAILIIMLVVAGPKRMIQWAYIMGKYVAKARAMWAESMAYIQKEFDEAGVDIQLPKEPPTRRGLSKHINQQVNKALTPVTKPMQDVLDDTKLEINPIKPQTPSTSRPVIASKSAPSMNTNGNGNGHGTVDLGTWSESGKTEE